MNFFLVFLFLTYPITAINSPFYPSQKLSEAAMTLTKDRVTYDPVYRKIGYPNGDVPSDKGVCTDVIIRAYRKLGTDLQKEVHVDMQNNFSKYPSKWGLKKNGYEY